MDILNCLNVFILLLGFKNFCVEAAESYYTAGVVEFRPIVTEISSTEILADHLKAYLDILASAENTDLDIIVFPEATLNNQPNPTFVPSEKDHIIPCIINNNNIYADFLVQLSCAARRIRKYLVINIKEKENCLLNKEEDPRPCALNNLNIFNTNVVFDREGRVVSRYRKVHVYVNNENTTYKPEFAIFNTDFGVRFGQFICFDILFYTPAQELVDRFAVTDFIFTTYFFSELPFLTAVQLQHGWAWGNNVTLLAAGASYPEWGATGSGIFSGEFGNLVSVMVTEKGERKLYKARIPKRGANFIPEIDTSRKNGHSINNLRLLKDPEIENYNSTLLHLEQNETYFEQELCDGDFCCTFKINANILNHSLEAEFKYRVGIFNGRRTYEKEEWSDIKVCALYTCANEQPSSCGEALITDNVLFKTIEINGSFPKSEKLLIIPSIIDDQLNPLKNNAIEWSKRKTNLSYEVKLKLIEEQTNILTFGIYGQYYEKSMAAFIKLSHMCFTVFLLLFWVGLQN